MEDQGSQGKDAEFTLNAAFESAGGHLRRAVRQANRPEGIHAAQGRGLEFYFQSYQVIIDGSCHRLKNGHPGRLLRVRRINSSAGERREKREAHGESRDKATLFPGTEKINLEHPKASTICKGLTPLLHA